MIIIILHKRKPVAEALKWSIEFSEKKRVQCRLLNFTADLPPQAGLLITDAFSFLSLSDKNQLPGYPALLVTHRIDDPQLTDALFTGVDAIANISHGPAEVLEKAKKLMNNKTDETQILLRNIILASRMPITAQIQETDYGLTRKEKEILKLLREANHLKLIAQMTNTSYETVRTHVKNIYKKIGVAYASEAVIKAIKMDLS